MLCFTTFFENSCQKGVYELVIILKGTSRFKAQLFLSYEVLPLELVNGSVYSGHGLG